MMEQPYWPAGSGEMAGLIGSHDWTVTPLGPSATWPLPLRTMVEVMLASPMVASLAVGPQLVFLYNDAASNHYGDRHPSLLGRPLAEAFVHEFERVRPFYDRVLVGESVHVAAQSLDPGRTGSTELFDAYLMPVRGTNGAVIAAFMTGFAIGARVKADAILRESEARYRLLIGSVAQAVWETDADGIVIADSPTWRAYTGQTLEGWLGYGWLDAVHPQDRAYAERQWREAIAVKGLVNIEFRLRAFDGGWRWTNVRAAPVFDAAGNVEKWAGMNIDIDDRKVAEARWRESEALRRVAFSGASMGAWRWDLGTRLILGDAQFLALWGFPPSDEAHPLSLFTDCMSPEGASEMEVIVTRAIKGGQEFDAALEIIAGPRAGHWIRWRGRANEDAPSILYGVTFDITDQKRAEAALRDSEERLQQLGEASKDVLWIRDAETLQWQYLSPAFEEIYGSSRAEALAGDNYRNWQDLIVPEDRAHVVQSIERVRLGESVTFEFRIQRPSDGEIRWLRNTDVPMLDVDGRIHRIGGVGHDATELKRMEDAIRGSEVHLRTLMEGVPQLIWRSCTQGRWTWASPQWLNYTGQSQEESYGWGWLNTVHPDDRSAAEQAWDEALPHGRLQVEYRVRRASDGAWRWHQTRSVPVRGTSKPGELEGPILEWLGTTTDIEDLKRLQGHQQILVAELQHRTRNLLAVVRNVARRSIDPSSGLDQYDARLSALSRVQGFLSRSTAYAVPLADIVQAELEAAGDGTSDRVWVNGPAVALPGESVQAVALALHELATNAVKYGAIAQSSGRLTVIWRLDDTGAQAGRRLVIDWRESGVVMPDEPPARRGFGTELITRALPYQLGAETALEFTTEGVNCRVVLPASAFSSSDTEDIS